MFDYAAGKADWAVSGQPMEGRTAGRRRAIDVARTDVPTFAPGQPLREVRAEMAGGDTDLCLIVDPRGVLLGRIDGDPAEADLPNDNTLITEGFTGRMFQVTSGGDVVWEYVNPHFHPTPLDPDAPGFETNLVFRASHYSPGEIPSLL